MIQILSAHKGRVKYKAWIAGGGNTGVITKFCPSQPTHWLPVLLFPHGCKTDSPLLKVPRSDITMQHSLKVPNLMSKPSKCGAEEAAGCHPWTAAPGVLFPSTQGPRKPKRQATYLNTPNTMVGEAQHNGHRDSGWKQGEWKVNSNSFEVRQGKCWISLDYVSSPRKSPLMVWASPSRLLVLLLESFFLPLKGATCWQLSSFSWQLPATEFRGSNDIFSSVLYSFQSKLEVFLLEWFPQEPHGPCLKLTVLSSNTHPDSFWDDPVSLLVSCWRGRGSWPLSSWMPSSLTERSMRHTFHLWNGPFCYWHCAFLFLVV